MQCHSLTVEFFTNEELHIKINSLSLIARQHLRAHHNDVPLERHSSFNFHSAPSFRCSQDDSAHSGQLLTRTSEYSMLEIGHHICGPGETHRWWGPFRALNDVNK